MARVTASSLERSLQNCSLSGTVTVTGGERIGSSSSAFSEPPQSSSSSSSSSSSNDNSTFVQLNSHVSLPYHWEQCLDLKTGELYYINWSTGKKAKEDPRTTGTGYNGDYYSEEDDDDDDDDESDSSSEEEEEESRRCESEESSSCSSTRDHFRLTKNNERHQQGEIRQDQVLVVAGCKGCFMYYMVPKHVDQCPKCCARLLHFPSNNTSSSP